jgi:hypothetical protein
MTCNFVVRMSQWVARMLGYGVLAMAELVPAIHVLAQGRKTWMPGTGPGMTNDSLQLSHYGVLVMAGLVPAIHVLAQGRKTRMPGTRAGHDER